MSGNFAVILSGVGTVSAKLKSILRKRNSIKFIFVLVLESIGSTCISSSRASWGAMACCPVLNISSRGKEKFWTLMEEITTARNVKIIEVFISENDKSCQLVSCWFHLPIPPLLLSYTLCCMIFTITVQSSCPVDRMDRMGGRVFTAWWATGRGDQVIK